MLLIIVILVTRSIRIFWCEVPYKISPKNIYFIVGSPYYEFKDTTKKLYIVAAMTTFSKSPWDHGVSVYDINGNGGVSLFYCPQDKGIYVEEVIATVVTKYSRGGWITKYYRIGECKIKDNRIIEISFPKGTQFNYKRKNPLEIEKSDWLIIKIPYALKEVPVDYFK